MRVLQLHTRYREAGGEDAVVAAEADLLRGAGHEVEQVLADNPKGAVAALASLVAAPWNPRAARAVRTTAQTRPFDVAHVHNTWFAQSPAVIRALDRLGLPLVMTLHNYRLLCANALLLRDGGPCELCVGSHPWHAVRYRCYRDSRASSVIAASTIALHRRLGTWTDRVGMFLAPSEFVRDRYVAAGFPPERIIVKRHVATDPGPRPEPPSASSTVLYVGRLSQEKGVAFLLDLWRRHGPDDLLLEIVGTGPLAATLRSDPPPGVHFVGALTPAQVRQRMGAARALLLPSLCYETASMVIVEALSAGLPVLASRLGALPEVVGQVGDEWLAAPGDSRSWMAGLARLGDPGHIDRSGAAARKVYTGQHTPERARRDLETVYAAVAQA